MSEINYKNLSPKEFIEQRGEIFIGSKKLEKNNLWTINNDKYEYMQVEYVPACVSFFNELLTNCIDHITRSNIDYKNVEPCDLIDITFTDNSIRFYNNGVGINHKKIKSLFCDIYSGSNYGERKYKGGSFGVGLKVVCFLAKYINVLSVCNGHQSILEFSNEVESKDSTLLNETYNKVDESDYTCIEVQLNYSCFGLKGLTEEIYNIFIRKILDAKIMIDKINSYFKLNVRLTLNQKPIKTCLAELVENLNGYLINEFFFIGIKSDKNEINFGSVNATEINTGSIINYYYKFLLTNLKKINDKITEKQIKDNIYFIVFDLVEDSEYDSNLKSCLKGKYTPTVKLQESLLKDIFIELTEFICSNKVVHEKKISNKDILNDTNLYDAKYAGSKKYDNCVLVIAEGKSALSAALAGLENFKKEERYLYGAYALTGKLKNMEKYTNDDLEDKMVESKLKKVIGIEKRRYGYILLMTDSDSDGYHIRSLVINFIHVCVPDMLFNNRILILNTPLITFDFKKESYDFFTFEQFYDFKRTNPNFKIPNNITYMKGCGTIKKQDIKRIFNSFQDFKTTISVNKDNLENTIDTLKNLFGKITLQRKVWANSKTKINLDLNVKEFLCDEYLLSCLTIYAKELNIRAVPLFNDGLKEVQRKILYSLLFKQKVKKMKLTEMASGITKECDYLHGETSMYESIIKLTQNNITGMITFPFIIADGHNGSRLCNGSDHAQARYLNVSLNDKTKYFFLNRQEKLFNYNKDELENNIEPKCLFPLIPLNFITVSKGLGFGFSHISFSYNIISLIEYLKGSSDKVEIEYNRFTGTIDEDNEDLNKIKMFGRYEIINDKEIQVQELPCLDLSVEKYKKELNNKIENKKHNIKTYHVDKYSEELEINIKFNQLPSSDESIYEILNLKSTATQILNFIFYSEDDEENNGLIFYYKNVYQYLDSFKDNMINNIYKLRTLLAEEYKEQLLLIENKIRYINDIRNGDIKIDKFNTPYINNKLEELKYMKIDNNFDYLIDMTIRSLTNENIQVLTNKFNKIEEDLTYVVNTTNEEYYINELEKLKSIIDDYKF